MASRMRAKLSLPVGPRDHVRGPASAPVTLVEYGDYECPYCRAAYPIVKEIQEAMGENLRFVFRNFPLTQIHPHAKRAGEAAEAAAAQDHFWQMHDLLYENQSALDDAHLLRFALVAGLDVERFTRELESGVHQAKVREDFLSGARSGVNGTPSFFINGIRHDGSWEFDPLLLVIQRELERTRAA